MIRKQDEDGIDKIQCIVGKVALEPEVSDNMSDTSLFDITRERFLIIEDIISALIGNRRGEGGMMAIPQES